MKTKLLLWMTIIAAGWWAGPAAAQELPERVHATDVIAFPGPWAFEVGHSGMTLVSDQQLEDFAADPDKPVNTSVSAKPQMRTLRQICETAQANGHDTLSIAFDFFWTQYRTDVANQPRKLYPDTPHYIELIGKVSQFAKEYGLGIELSLLTPLEIGKGYHEKTGESGMWMHYREGVRDPKSGAYSVQLWRQKAWTNNKGTIGLEDAGVRVFAFRATPVAGTRYTAVDPGQIVEISDTAKVDVWAGARMGAADRGDDPTALGGYAAERVRVYGEGRGDLGPLDRVLIVQQYRTPEMDYFSATARPFLHDLVDQYVAAGVHINALYADETHIQGDWGYFNHHDHGELAVRYVSPGFQQMFADRYGEEYRDFAKWLVYFSHGQNDASNDLRAKEDMMHVIGGSPAQIRATALLRARYLELLQDEVVNLFLEAKVYLESKMGHRIPARAHATWAESPTIDDYRSGLINPYSMKYEYTSNFVWSNTIHQAASACADYFKWGEFLYGTGNDTAECGWLDRNYTGFAQASSLGILNDVRNSYAAHWGMPQEVNRRRRALADAWGTAPTKPYGIVQNMEHRDVEVLMLYPLDLVAADERFGSWMTQYAYTNYITQAKLLERGTVQDGAVVISGRRFTTLVALYEPFPRPELLTMMQQLAEQGGRVVWAGTPPVIMRDGSDALAAWQGLTGVNYTPTTDDGYIAAGKQVTFEGALAAVTPMTILTDFLVDRIYPVVPAEGTQVVARVKGQPVGTRRELAGGGSVTVLGMRPRDDQSKSLGYDERHWFEILNALGAYAPSGKIAGVNDNTETLSRTGDLFTARFPNGSVSVVPHLRDVEEVWPGGFHRNAEEDAKIMEQVQLPSEKLDLNGMQAAGHTFTFKGSGAMVFRVDAAGQLVAFAGRECDRITVDGRETVFAEAPVGWVAWAPVEAERRVAGGATMIVMATGGSSLQIPVPGLTGTVEVVREGRQPGTRGDVFESQVVDGVLKFKTDRGMETYYVIPKP